MFSFGDIFYKFKCETAPSAVTLDIQAGIHKRAHALPFKARLLSLNSKRIILTILKGHLSRCKRLPFRRQKVTFYKLKGNLLECGGCRTETERKSFEKVTDRK